MSASRRRSTHLTKSRFMAGSQCVKRLWLEVHRPRLGTPPDAARRALFEQGTAVGVAARKLFPGGELIDEPPWAHDVAVARTRERMADPGVPALYEAAFEHQGVRVRVDILERLEDGAWGLHEVKASKSVKPEHAEDLAVQRFVLEGAGVRVSTVQLIHVSGDYVREAGEVEWSAFFRTADLGSACDGLVDEVRRRVERFHALLAERSEPEVEPSRHCKSPYPCPLWDHCTQAKPADWIFRLPGISNDMLGELREQGVERIPEIPEPFALNPLQTRVRDAHATGRRFVSATLRESLAGSGPPAFYLDFETMNPAIPLHAGTRPYPLIPFQWSLHHRDAEGAVTHREFLADPAEDPRRPLAVSLLEALAGSTDPIVVYSGFEAARIAALMSSLPDLAGLLGPLLPRLHDLLPIVRLHVYHPGFRGSFSLKAVAPTLAPQIRYDDLGDLASGDVAAATFARLARGEVDLGELAKLRRALLAYCERDTQALLELHRALGELHEDA